MSSNLIIIAFALLTVIGLTIAFQPPYFPQTSYLCNGQMYNVYSSICCGTKVSPITGFKRPACCGTEAFDREKQLCCAGHLVQRAPGVNACCSSDGIDLSLKECCAGTQITRLTEICCGGKKLTRASIYEVCCGDVQMDTTKSLCCGGTVRHIASTFPLGNNLVPSTFACCGNSIFQVRTNYCFYGQVYPRTNYVPWWQWYHHHHHH